MNDWIPLPPEGVAVETKIVDDAGERAARLLKYHRTIWWEPDFSNMAIEPPTHWRFIDAPETPSEPTELI